MPLTAITTSDFEPKTADQAAKHFARKAALTSEAFERLSNEAKARAFRIAGVHKVNLVQRARDIVHKAILEGTPYADVQRALLGLFDADGVPGISRPRLRSMFHQHVHQAYIDARREALDDPEQARAFPFRRYMTIGNGVPGVRNVRPTHAALHGLVFKWNDPFWDAHTPPWDFGCRCIFTPLTERQVRRMGVKVRGLGYVRKQVRVRGQRKRGIEADPRFVRGKINLTQVDEELRRVMEEYGE